MSITKLAARTRTLQFMDATGSLRWDTTANGEVDQAISYTADQEWRTILDANPYVATQAITTPLITGGTVAKSTLTTGAGDTVKRLYKVLGLNVNLTPVKIEPFATDYLGAFVAGAASQPTIAYEFGDNFQILPTSLGGTSSIWFVNYLPARFDTLATDNSFFPFPDSFEDVPLLEAAAYLLASKGGAESEAAIPLVGLAKKRRADMLRTLERPTTAPMQMRYADSSATWGQ